MMVNGLMINHMEWGNNHIKMEVFILAISLMDKNLEMVLSNGLMEVNIKGSL